MHDPLVAAAGPRIGTRLRQAPPSTATRAESECAVDRQAYEDRVEAAVVEESANVARTSGPRLATTSQRAVALGAKESLAEPQADESLATQAIASSLTQWAVPSTSSR